MTHPFHPLLGEELERVSERGWHGEHRVQVVDGQGAIRSLPARWTDLVVPDPSVVLGAGRSAFRIEDLLRLESLVGHLRRSDDRAVGGDDV